MSGFLQQLTMSGAEQTVVADLNEARREDVLQEATNELCGRNGAALELLSGRLLVGESNLTVLQIFEAPVRDSDAKDVRGEILAGCFAAANRLGMDHPGFAPDGGLD